MKLINSKGVSKDKHVISVVEQLVQHPELFVQVSRIFTDYNTAPSDTEEVNEYVDSLFHSPKVKSPTDVIEKLITAIRSIYSLNTEHFNSIKSKILEKIIYEFGPFTEGLERKQIFIEPTIKDGDYTVGESDNKCDFVFYEKNEKPLELIECKSNISSIIPKKLSFENSQRSAQKKVSYLHRAYVYLEETYCKPFIYFACYNAYIKSEKRNLQEHWGYPHISILNPEIILKMYLFRLGKDRLRNM